MIYWIQETPRDAWEQRLCSKFSQYKILYFSYLFKNYFIPKYELSFMIIEVLLASFLAMDFILRHLKFVKRWDPS
jgi:hypothetical protein